jgi:Xaa-Pro aminopeptidase
MKILHVAGARPNFMKVAPLVRAFEALHVAAPICHTGQHYDAAMSRLFFDELAIPRPAVNLEVGSGSHAVQTARVMERFEAVLAGERPIISRLVSMENPLEIKEGMVFALETYCPAKDGRSAARIEEEVVVTDKGCEVITLFPAEELPVANQY